MREGVLPATVVATALVAFVAYISFQGSSHAVEFAVTSSDVAVVPADAARLDPQWRQRAGTGRVMLVEVSWHASESIAAGSYAVMVATPPRWRHLGCRPECEWTDGQGLSELGDQLPRTPYRLAATFEAEETGAARVAFGSTLEAAGMPRGYLPVGWLVQTNGDDVLGVEQIPLELKGAA